MGIFRGSGGAIESTRNALASQVAVDSATASAKAQEATQAATSATSNAQSVANTYDTFDDRYLGTKSSDPSLDNDNEALVAGALYFNTVDNILKIYDGSVWNVTAVDASDFLTQTQTDTLYEPLLSDNRRMNFYRQDNAPATALEGDMWYDTDDEDIKMYRQTGTNQFEWVAIIVGADDSDIMDAGNF